MKRIVASEARHYYPDREQKSRRRQMEREMDIKHER